MIIRCKNWESDMALCGATCGVEVADVDLSGAWIRIVLADAPEWFVTVRSCSDHGHHTDPYCSIACFISYHASHDHADSHLVEVSG